MRPELIAKTLAPLVIAMSGFAVAQEHQQSLKPDTPELDACRAAGLIALKESVPATKNAAIDPDSMRLFKMDKTIDGEPVRAILMGDVSIEQVRSSKPRSLVCIVGDKGWATRERCC